MDSVVSCILAIDKSRFAEYTTGNGTIVEIGTKAKAQICRHGDIIFHVLVGNETYRCHFKDVWHVGALGYLLLLVSKVNLKGLNTTFGNSWFVVIKGERTIVAWCTRSSLPYTVGELRECSPFVVAKIAAISLCHERIAIANENGTVPMSQKSTVWGVQSLYSLRKHKIPAACLESPTEQASWYTNQLRVHQECFSFHIHTFALQLRLCLLVENSIL